MWRKSFFIGLVIFAGLLTAACFRPTGIAGLAPTAGSGAPSTPTETPAPTETQTDLAEAPPAQTDPTQTPLPTQAPTEPIPTETPAPIDRPPTQTAGMPSDALRSPTPRVVVVAPTCPPSEGTPCPPCECSTEPPPEAKPTTTSSSAEQLEPGGPPIAPPSGGGEAVRCPPQVEAMSLAPERPSNDLRALPPEIDYFLSDGGTLAQLELGLARWDVLVPDTEAIEGPFDSDDEPDIAVAVQMRVPGSEAYNVWVFNCRGDVLYQAFPEPDARPIALEFRELDGEQGSRELFFGLETCTGAGCRTTWHAIKWLGPYPGDVADLLAGLPVFEESQVNDLDFADDALMFTEYAENPPGEPPTRDIVHTWTLNEEGTAFVETLVEYTEPAYRHQMLRAGDDALGVSLDLALARYKAAPLQEDLELWPNETAQDVRTALNAFSRYRIMQAALLAGDTQTARRAYTELLLFDDVDGGAEIARLGDAFWQSYNEFANLGGSSRQAMSAACEGIAELEAITPPARDVALSFGFIREADALCPF